MINPFVISTIRTGIRSRSIQLAIFLGLGLVSCAYLASMFSPRQPQTVALDVGITGLRITLVLLALIWVQDFLGKEIERKTILIQLAYPCTRARYLVGKYLGVALLLMVAVIGLGMALWLVVFISDRGYHAARPVDMGVAYWMCLFGVYLDALVIAAFAICIAALSTIPMLPLVMGGIFAIVTRNIGDVVDLILVRNGGGDGELASQYANVINIIKLILPDLSRLDWRDWPLYQISSGRQVLFLATVMAVSYLLVLMLIAIGIFEKREFA